MPPREQFDLSRILHALVRADAPAYDRAALHDIPEALAAPLARLRRGWSLIAHGDAPDDARTRIRRIVSAEGLPTMSECAVPSDRHAVVIAHGPHFEENRAALSGARDRLWIVAPFRTALHLAGGNLVPDVVILAERDARPLASSIDAWNGLSQNRRTCLARLPFVVDPFAPPEVYAACSRVYRFDSGFGSPEALPFHGFGVLAAISLALAQGHRRVALAGVGPDERLAAALEVLTFAKDIERVDLTGGATPYGGWGRLSVEAYAAAPPRVQAGRFRAAVDAWSPRESAANLLTLEVEALSALSAVVDNGLDALARLDRDGSDAEAFGRLHGLMHEVVHEWPSHDRLRTAVELAQPAFLMRLWAANAVRHVEPFDRERSTRTTATLVLHELAAALSRCGREQAAPLEMLLATGMELVA